MQHFWGLSLQKFKGPEIQFIPSLDRMPILAKHPFFVTRPSENVRVWGKYSAVDEKQYSVARAHPIRSSAIPLAKAATAPKSRIVFPSHPHLRRSSVTWVLSARDQFDLALMNFSCDPANECSRRSGLMIIELTGWRRQCSPEEILGKL
jgi:hypothetical protein